jgi:hypothetical protein
VHVRISAESLIRLEKSRLEHLVQDYGRDGTVENSFILSQLATAFVRARLPPRLTYRDRLGLLTALREISQCLFHLIDQDQTQIAGLE